MRIQVRSLASLSGLKILYCHELWIWLRSDVAVAVVYAGSCSSNWTPSLGTSVCRKCGPKKHEKKKKDFAHQAAESRGP